jgi:MtrB/PioB family decaheme-associated outer membrane protein
MDTARRAGVVLTAVTLVVLGSGRPGAAQLAVGGYNVEGYVEGGYRLVPGDPPARRQAKFEEYRDLSEGPLLAALQLRLFRPDEGYSAELSGSRWGYEDQEYSLRSGALGRWQFGFDWDQTPHTFSTTARMLATEVRPGVFVLPSPRPALAAYNSARDLDRLSVRWDTARMFLTLHLGPDIDLNAQYTRTHKEGERPFSMAFGSPGNNFMEILEPIDQTTHDFRLRGVLARPDWQLQFGYTFSMFEQGVRSTTADNPCFANAAQCGAGDGGAAAPPRGQISLAPNNMAHTVNLAGGVNLPMRTRVNANLAYSVFLQNDSFLPATINPALAATPNAALLDGSGRSLNGLVGNLLLNVNATTRPLAPLTLSAKYRLYDHNDMSDEVTFRAFAGSNDRVALTLQPQRATRLQFTRQNVDLDGRWRFGNPVALTVGAGWESWDRGRIREVEHTDEVYGKAAVDVTPNDWLLARLTLRESARRYDGYDRINFWREFRFSGLPSPNASDHPAMRKFDEAERDRHEVSGLVQVTPSDVLSAGFTASYRYDDYLASRLGLQTEIGWSTGVDVTWTPVPRATFVAGYVHEVEFRRQRNENRITPAAADNFDWLGLNTDVIDTFHLGANVTVIPDVLEWKLGAAYSMATGQMETRNPDPLVTGTLAQQIQSAGKRMPALTDSLLRLDTSLRYRFWKNWSANLGYIFEEFSSHDWRTNNLVPFTPGLTSIYLGNDLKPYTAHVLAVTLGYRFR